MSNPASKTPRNASGDTSSSPAGLETYCFTPAGMPSSITRGYSDDPRLVLPNNAFDDQNLRYALRLHRALLQVNGNNDRGIRHARFLDVLAGQNRPAVLIEGGYLSNPTEAKQIAEPEYPVNIQQPMIDAVTKYFRDEGPNPCSLEEALVVMQMMDRAR